VYRWVQRLTPLFADAARPLRNATGDRWLVDETYAKIAADGGTFTGRRPVRAGQWLLSCLCNLILVVGHRYAPSRSGRVRARVPSAWRQPWTMLPSTSRPGAHMLGSPSTLAWPAGACQRFCVSA
jgi:hypothetical protein